MPEIELSAGTVAYEDTGGEGPVVVLLHGLLHDAVVGAQFRDERDDGAGIERDAEDIGGRVFLPLGTIAGRRRNGGDAR